MRIGESVRARPEYHVCRAIRVPKLSAIFMTLKTMDATLRPLTLTTAAIVSQTMRTTKNMSGRH